MAARTKRNTRTTRTTQARRTPRRATTTTAALGQIRNNAMGAMDKMVKQGAALQVKTRKLAYAKAKEARAAMVGAGKVVTAKADEARTRTLDAVSQLEKVFENRVHSAVAKLGVPTSRDIRALSRQVAQLQQSVDQLRRARART